MIKTNISIFLLIVIFSGCVSLEPKLEPLDSKVIPKEWKTNIENNSNDLALIKPSWEDFVKDETLKKVVSKAIENNKDLKIALLNIEAARATYRISRADLFPNITGNMDISHSKSLNSSNNSTISHNYNANIAASYELDLFGKIKSLNENALNSYLSTQFATNATKISLISETINAWIILASNMEQLELAKQTATNLQKVYELTQKRFTAGVVSKNDVYDANASLKESELNVISYSKKVEENKNALELLIAEPLKEDFLPKDFESYKNSLMIVKSGVSSNILLSRPDIMEAEYNLKAKNANIGAARAAFFPSISLTASSGLASRSLSSLFDGGAKSIWSFSPNISIPIFNAGENQANLDYSYAQKDIALLEYEKSIQTAFKEVSDTLITRATIKEQIQKQKELVDSVSKSYDISLNSYKIGVGSYLNVLIAQRTLISSQQALINTYLEDLTNRVSLYSVFGGNEKVE
ncbi:efflux transporter outer membrane subunit [Arcobacter defluvii]|uniref:RND family efflux system, outer membrane channel protein, TolC family n=1 Tax=Arcobacter defluvii TaxID=873191 RepID=A0AAE7E8B1_9BACT|nr:efflux transporter outer membrane subunit [Arcobacter defluvii]QKF78911.1 RND family efflux system, outer membrane channel protein, TolC family [Arcobacter defluvii]RXI30747.1 RND transporter [Arcobacter defluvii]